MSNICDRCRRSRPSFHNHALCPQCRIAASVCNVDVSNSCTICVNWTTRTWNKLRKSLVDARLRTTQRGRQHWTSAFPSIEAWIMTKPASGAASSEPGSEIFSFMDSGDDLSEKLVASMTGPLIEELVAQNSNEVTANMAGTALPSTVTALRVALPLTPSTIQSIVVPLSVQDTPSVAGSSCMPLISMPQVTQGAGPLISMPHAAVQPAAMQPSAMQFTAMPRSYLSQDKPVSQAQFPVLLPQGQGRPLPVLVRHGDLDSMGMREFLLRPG